MSNPIVTIEMEDGGIIRAELYPEIASATLSVSSRRAFTTA